MQRSPLRLSLVALALAAFAFAACSDDGDGGSSDAAGSSDDAESGSDATTTSTEEAAGTGSGTFVVGDRTFTFEAASCTIDDDEDAPRIEAAGKGTFDNRPFTVTVRHSESETSAIETVQVAFTASEALVGTNFVALPSGADQVKIKAVGEGKAEGEMTMTGTGGQPSGEGKLTLECEA